MLYNYFMGFVVENYDSEEDWYLKLTIQCKNRCILIHFIYVARGGNTAYAQGFLDSDLGQVFDIQRSLNHLALKI